MAFPTTGPLDDFNRTNGALGANWTGGFFGDTNNIVIVSNAAIGSSAAAFSGSSWNTQIGPDFEAWVILAAGFTGGATNEFYLEGLDSQTSGSPNGFAVEIAATGNANKGMRLVRFDAGALVALVTDTTITWATGDGLGFSRVGTTLTMYRQPSGGSWAQVGTTATDSHYATSLFFGMEQQDNTANQATADTFGGGTLGAGNPPVVSGLKTAYRVAVTRSSWF